MTTLLNEAVRAALSGYHIFPTEPGEKTPIRIYQEKSKDEAPWTVRWSEIATNDLETVVRWWTYAPLANIGVACKPSGLLVVDCDIPKKDGLLSGTPWADLHEFLGPLVDGETLYDQVAQRYGGPQGIVDAFDTFQVRTGSGGLHLYYRWPDGVQATQDSIVRGVLDVRCNGGERGGYVLGEGSHTKAGGYVRANRSSVREAPGWLVELCRDKPRTTRPEQRVFEKPRVLNYQGLINTIKFNYEGNRNNSLFWAARAACADGLSQEECEDLLIPPYMEVGGPGGESQARSSIRSAYRNQQRKMGS